MLAHPVWSKSCCGQLGRPRRAGAPDLVAVRELAQQEDEVEQSVPDAQNRRGVQGDRPFRQDGEERTSVRSLLRCGCLRLLGRVAAAWVPRAMTAQFPWGATFHQGRYRVSTGFGATAAAGGRPLRRARRWARSITRSWMDSNVPPSVGGDAVSRDVAQVLLHHQRPLRARPVVAAVQFRGRNSRPGAACSAPCGSGKTLCSPPSVSTPVRSNQPLTWTVPSGAVCMVLPRSAG